MGKPVKFKYGTEAQILALTPDDSKWVDGAFYYPSDKTYFFQAVDGVMKRYGSGESIVTSVGVTLNGLAVSGHKSLIEENDVLVIPTNYEYNPMRLNVFGQINCYGEINI